MLSIKTESKKLRRRKHKSIFSFISISLCGITAYLFLPFLLSFGFPLLSFLFSYLLLSSSFLYIYIVLLLEPSNASFFLSSSFIISANLPIFFIYLFTRTGHCSFMSLFYLFTHDFQFLPFLFVFLCLHFFCSFTFSSHFSLK
jgi:hypothetical protein